MTLFEVLFDRFEKRWWDVWSTFDSMLRVNEISSSRTTPIIPTFHPRKVYSRLRVHTRRLCSTLRSVQRQEGYNGAVSVAVVLAHVVGPNTIEAEVVHHASGGVSRGCSQIYKSNAFLH